MLDQLAGLLFDSCSSMPLCAKKSKLRKFPETGKFLHMPALFRRLAHTRHHRALGSEKIGGIACNIKPTKPLAPQAPTQSSLGS